MVSLCLLVGALQSWVGTSCSNDPATNSSSKYQKLNSVKSITRSGSELSVQFGIDKSGKNPELKFSSLFISPALYFVPAGSAFNKDGIGDTRRWRSNDLYDMDDLEQSVVTFKAKMNDAGVFRIFSSPRKCEISSASGGNCVWSDFPTRNYAEECSGFPRFLVNPGFSPTINGYKWKQYKKFLISVVLPDEGLPSSASLSIDGGRGIPINVSGFDAVLESERISGTKAYIGSVASGEAKMSVIRMSDGFRFAAISMAYSSVNGGLGDVKFCDVTFSLGGKNYIIRANFNETWLIDRQTITPRPAEAFLAFLQFGNQSYGSPAFNAAWVRDGGDDWVTSAFHSNLIEIPAKTMMGPVEEELPDVFLNSYARLNFGRNSEAKMFLEGGNAFFVTDGENSIYYWSNSSQVLRELSLEPSYISEKKAYRVSADDVADVISNGLWVTRKDEDHSNEYVSETSQQTDIGSGWNVGMFEWVGNVGVNRGEWRGFYNERPLVFRSKIAARFEQGALTPTISKRIDGWIPAKSEVLPAGNKTTFKLSRTPYIEDQITSIDNSTTISVAMKSRYAELNVSDYNLNTSKFNVAPAAVKKNHSCYVGMLGLMNGSSGSYKIITPLEHCISNDVTYVLSGDSDSKQRKDNVVDFTTMPGFVFLDGKSKKSEILSALFQNSGYYTEIVDLSRWNLGKVYDLIGGKYIPDASDKELAELGVLLNGIPKSSEGIGESVSDALMVNSVIATHSSSTATIAESEREGLKLHGLDVMEDLIDVKQVEKLGAYIYNDPNKHNFYRGLTMSAGAVELCRAAGNNRIACQTTGTYLKYKPEIDAVAYDFGTTIGGVLMPELDFAIAVIQAKKDWEEGNRFTAGINVALSVTPFDEVGGALGKLLKGRKLSQAQEVIEQASKLDAEAFKRKALELGSEIINGKVKVDPKFLEAYFHKEFSTREIADLAEEIKRDYGDVVTFHIVLNRALGKKKEKAFIELAKGGTSKAKEYLEYLTKLKSQCGTPCDQIEGFGLYHQVTFKIPGGGTFIADNAWFNSNLKKWIIDDTKLSVNADFQKGQKSALKALREGRNGFEATTQLESGLSHDLGQKMDIAYFGRTNGSGLPSDGVFEPSAEWIMSP